MCDFPALCLGCSDCIPENWRDLKSPLCSSTLFLITYTSLDTWVQQPSGLHQTQLRIWFRKTTWRLGHDLGLT
ncbi:hypothetical protein Hdeb2414_s0023g00629831 [Helianthus debilis subsp. tardiflorus]